MAGTFNKDDIARMISDTARWRDLDLEVKGCLEPAAGLAILAYVAKAMRMNNDTYAAAVTSAYVKRNGAWKMVLHQQTPLPAGKAASA